MRRIAHWIRSQDEGTRRGFVVVSTSVSFLVIFLGWLAFDPFGGIRPQSSPKAEVAGEQTPSMKQAPSPTPAPTPDSLPLDLSGIATPPPPVQHESSPSPTPAPLFIHQDTPPVTPEL